MLVPSIGLNKIGCPKGIGFKSGIHAGETITALQKHISPTSLINCEIDKLAEKLSVAPMEAKGGIRKEMADLALKLARVNKH